MFRRSLQKVFSKTLGDRDYVIFEAVLVGLRLPLVFSLKECVSLNAVGARVLRPKKVICQGDDDASVTWDSKIDIFDDRYRRVTEKQRKNGRNIVLNTTARKAKLIITITLSRVVIIKAMEIAISMIVWDICLLLCKEICPQQLRHQVIYLLSC